MQGVGPDRRAANQLPFMSTMHSSKDEMKLIWRVSKDLATGAVFQQ